MGLKIVAGDGMFSDREQAGRLLGKELADHAGPETLVLGIPRGGVIVGACVAEALKAALDVVVARKLRAPFNPELAIGAVMEDGETYLNHNLMSTLGVEQDYLDKEIALQVKDLESRVARYRERCPFVSRKGRRLIVVDDGVATGATMIVTLQGLRSTKPESFYCALPVGPPTTLDQLAKIADEVVCLTAPVGFQAVGQFYQSFDQVPDTEVLAVLDKVGPV